MVDAVPLPQGSLASGVPFESYRDAFRVEVDPARVPDVDAFARAFAAGVPGWVRALMGVRDAIVSVAGLKRAKDAPPFDPRAPLVPGAFLGFFRVLARTDRELLLGEDDRHLDFRVSMLHDGTSVTVSTLVRIHGTLGRLYFLPVAPLHRLLVPAMLRAAVRASRTRGRSDRSSRASRRRRTARCSSRAGPAGSAGNRPPPRA